MNRLIRPALALLVLGSLVAVTVILRETAARQPASTDDDRLVFQAPNRQETLQYPPAFLRVPDKVKPVAFDFPPPPVPTAHVNKNEKGTEDNSFDAQTPEIQRLPETNSLPEPVVIAEDKAGEQGTALDSPDFNLDFDLDADFSSLPEWQLEEAPQEKLQLNSTDDASNPIIRSADEFALGDIERLPALPEDVQDESPDPEWTMPSLQLNRPPSSIAEFSAGAEEPEELGSSVPQPTRNPDLAVAGRLAEERIDHGTSLATRNAYYSARKEFEAALRLICTALDAQDAEPSHSRKLAAGLRALREADDFTISEQRQWEEEIDLTAIIKGHRTPVLQNSAGAPVSPWVARQRYYTYAQQQLAEACRHEPVASRALYSMGKWYSFVAIKDDGILVSGPKAVVFFQAALSVDPRNHLAANELGVLLARFGQLPDARRVLLHAVSVGGQAEAWHNLAVVHRRLGEIGLANRAEHEGQLARRHPPASPYRSGKPVSWVDPQAFIQMSPKEAAPQTQTGSPTRRPIVQPCLLGRTEFKLAR